MLPEWLAPYLPAITAVLGVLISWALKTDSSAVAWFKELNGWSKIGTLLVIALIYGALIHFGLGQDLVDGVMQVLLLMLGTQVGYVMNPGGKG